MFEAFPQHWKYQKYENHWHEHDQCIGVHILNENKHLLKGECCKDSKIGCPCPKGKNNQLIWLYQGLTPKCNFWQKKMFFVNSFVTSTDLFSFQKIRYTLHFSIKTLTSWINNVFILTVLVLLKKTKLLRFEVYGIWHSVLTYRAHLKAMEAMANVYSQRLIITLTV